MSENLRDEIAEVLYETYWDLRDGVEAPKLGSFNAGREMAHAVLAVVGPELDRLRAEAEAVRDTWFQRAVKAQAERDDLRARLAEVDALADEWDAAPNPAPLLRSLRSALRAALASVPEPSDGAPAPVCPCTLSGSRQTHCPLHGYSEPADGVTVVASTPDGGERWTEYGVQTDDGSVRWVYAEEGLARLRADMSGGLVVGSTVTRSPWLPVLMDAADAYRKKPAPDPDRECCDLCGVSEATGWHGGHCDTCCRRDGHSPDADREAGGE